MAGSDRFDLLVVGGGINGAGIARDAAGRGLKVALVERDDLGQHTSSASTKLIHGGLRYLEQGNLRLVRESLAERERLLRIAPHLVRPLEFVIAPTATSRPMWLMRAGLLLYDRLGGKSSLPPSRVVDLQTDQRGAPLRDRAGMGLAYFDCWVDDSRLVVLNALDAAERGAVIWSRTELVGARREAGEWVATLRDGSGERSVRAAALVNASGPWVEQVARRIASGALETRTRLVKGSHLILPRLYEGEHAYLLQNPDGRVVFAIPYEMDFTLVGTTEVVVGVPDRHPDVSPQEIDYLLGTVRRTFARPDSAREIVGTFAGIRPLQDDGAKRPSSVTRDYAVELDALGAPLATVIGGKLTTYRRLAEKVMAKLGTVMPIDAGEWTASQPLPGGDIQGADTLLEQLKARHPKLAPALLKRLGGSYGSRALALLEGCEAPGDLGKCFGGDLHAREVDYLLGQEWARTAEDILFRRTKLGLRLGERAVADIERYLAGTGGSP